MAGLNAKVVVGVLHRIADGSATTHDFAALAIGMGIAEEVRRWAKGMPRDTSLLVEMGSIFDALQDESPGPGTPEVAVRIKSIHARLKARSQDEANMARRN